MQTDRHTCRVARKQKIAPHNFLQPCKLQYHSCMQIWPRNHTNIRIYAHTIPTHMSSTLKLYANDWARFLRMFHIYIIGHFRIHLRGSGSDETGNWTSQPPTTSQPVRFDTDQTVVMLWPEVMTACLKVFCGLTYSRTKTGIDSGCYIHKELSFIIIIRILIVRCITVIGHSCIRLSGG